MQDFTFITQVKDEPLALLVLGAIVVLEIIKLLIKNVPPLFKWLFFRNKEKPAEELEQKEWQGFIGKRIDEIETKIEKLFSAISVNEYLTSKISEGTLTNQLFSDELWPFLRLKAFRRLLAKKKNGRIWEKGFSLVTNHKEDWLNVLDTELGVKIIDEEYYQARLDEIRKRIFEDFSNK